MGDLVGRRGWSISGGGVRRWDGGSGVDGGRRGDGGCDAIDLLVFEWGRRRGGGKLVIRSKDCD